MAFDLPGYLRQKADVQATYNDGVEWVIQCSCDISKNSSQFHLWVNVKKEQGYCYRCKRRLGDLTAIIQLVDGCDLEEAIRLIKEQTSGSALLEAAIKKLDPDEDLSSSSDAEHYGIELPAGYVSSRKLPTVPTYLRKRGLDLKTCRRHDIGWCEWGYYARRAIFPIHNLDGDLVSFVARYMALRVPKGIKKVVYPRGSKISQVLYNHERVLKSDHVIVTEGVFDALKVGDDKAVAIFGKHVSRQQVAMLADLGATRKITILLDGDAQEEALELAGDLSVVCDRVWVASLPPDMDPSGASRKALKTALKGAFEPFCGYQRIKNAQSVL